MHRLESSSELAESQKRWMDLSEASAFLGVHFTTLRRWVDAGKAPCIRTPGGRRRFDRVELAAFLAAMHEGEVYDSTAAPGFIVGSRVRRLTAGAPARRTVVWPSGRSGPRCDAQRRPASHGGADAICQPRQRRRAVLAGGSAPGRALRRDVPSTPGFPWSKPCAPSSPCAATSKTPSTRRGHWPVRLTPKPGGSTTA